MKRCLTFTLQRLKALRHAHVLTGLPDSYGRGRIIPEVTRVALYGTSFLISQKQADKALGDERVFSEDWARDREEIAEQVKALKALTKLGEMYGFDISRPARDAKEAVQWLYFGYLAAIKSQDGAAMSIGRLSPFIDAYIERDLKTGVLTEQAAQELVDQFVIKLRIVRFLRTEDYDQIFSGDPYWATWTDGGFSADGRPQVTKTSFRLLQTLYNLGAAPEPNITILWDEGLPEGYKQFCSKVSVQTSSIQYESDTQIRERWGDNAAIACCVSPIPYGEGIQYFGARANLGKAFLYAINGGKDELTGEQVYPVGLIEPLQGDVLDYGEVWKNFRKSMAYLATQYIKALNLIHWSHDKYAYEAAEMALISSSPQRVFGCGIAGLSIVADSLAAIKYATVKPVRNKDGVVADYETVGEFPVYGNDDDRADGLAQDVLNTFMGEVRKQKTYRDALPTLSVLTITSNVVYGKSSGSFPSGHKAHTPYAPGANPENGYDTHGPVASALSVAKLDYANAEDGISLTNTLTPGGLGRTLPEQVHNLTGILDGTFSSGLYHMNVNVLNKETLEDAMEHPDNYPSLTVRVSGYAVNFVKLTREQQLDVLSRTFHH